MRRLYSLFFYLILPALFVRLYWRSLKQPAYRKRLAERVGCYPVKLEKSLWIHAVSVGETLAAIPLIKALALRFPHLPLLVTTMTPTGAAQVKAAFGETIIHAYLPYDLPNAVNGFLQAFHPAAGILMETELWPNLLAACAQNKIPVCLLNARLSAKSAKGYQRIGSITCAMLQKLSFIASHGKMDAERFIALGAPKERVYVTGNIKFDLELPVHLAHDGIQLRQSLGNRLTWIAASTHEGEEKVVLAAHQSIRKVYPEALLILVPRHPDRFAGVAKLCAQFFPTIRRSEHLACNEETAVYLGDTMGELLLLYSAADIVFVGGSLIPHGGHNMLEPAALGKPVLMGPSFFNFAEIGHLFLSAKALLPVQDTETLAANVLHLISDPELRHKTGERALQVVAANRGALAKQIALVSQVIESCVK